MSYDKWFKSCAMATALFLAHIPAVPAALITAWEFEDVQFDPALETQMLERYLEANRLGWRFCRRLEKTLEDGGEQAVLSELRRFYRMASPARLSELSKP